MTPFPLMVWQQPASTMAMWKARGCTHIITDKVKPDHSPPTRETYMKAAETAGIKVIIGADADPADDLAYPAFDGWMNLPDEPENWGRIPPDPANPGQYLWAQKIGEYVERYKKLKTAFPATPVFGNFNGGPLCSALEAGGNPRNPLQKHYKEFFKGADYVGADFYVRPVGRPAVAYLDVIPKYLKRIAAWAPVAAKPWAFIETCDLGKTNVGHDHPTPGEIRAAVYVAIAHGAKAIGYFPLKVEGGFDWDNTLPPQATEITKINSELTALAPFFLNGTRTMVVDTTSESHATFTLDGKTLAVRVWLDGAVPKTEVKVTGGAPSGEVEKLKAEVARLSSQAKGTQASLRLLADSIKP